jgi:hypothetical protein
MQVVVVLLPSPAALHQRDKTALHFLVYRMSRVCRESVSRTSAQPVMRSDPRRRSVCTMRTRTQACLRCNTDSSIFLWEITSTRRVLVPEFLFYEVGVNGLKECLTLKRYGSLIGGNDVHFSAVADS